MLVTNEESRLGDLECSRLSAVSHVTWFGLQWGLMLDDSTANIATGLATVPAGTDFSAVCLQAFCIVKALREAATARFTLMGWLDEEWETASRQIQELEPFLVQSYLAGHPNDTE